MWISSEIFDCLKREGDKTQPKYGLQMCDRVPPHLMLFCNQEIATRGERKGGGGNPKTAKPHS